MQRPIHILGRRSFHHTSRTFTPRRPIPPAQASELIPKRHNIPQDVAALEQELFEVMSRPPQIKVSYAKPLLFGVCACAGSFLVAGVVFERQQETAWQRLSVRFRQKRTELARWLGRQRLPDDEQPTMKELWIEKKKMMIEKRQLWLDAMYVRFQRLQDVYGLPESVKRAVLMVCNKYASMTESERTLAALVGINVLVFGAWQVPRWTPFMSRWFLHHPGGSHPITLVTSCFSHKEGLHLAFNMVGLWSFGGLMHDYLGREQFLAMYLSTGIGANMVSHTMSLALRHSRPLLPSLGASGALYGLLAGTAYLQPNASVSLIFLPMVPIKLGYALPAMMGFDLAGILLKWKMFDHFAHLAGASIGLGYMAYGPQYIWSPLIHRIEQARHHHRQEA